jgi:hypothetical protein
LRRFLRIGRPHHLPNDRDRIVAFDRHRDNRTRRDEVEQLAEERLLDMLGVVFAREFLVDRDHLHRDDVERLLLETPDDLAGELPPDSVRLHEHERALLHCFTPTCLLMTLV